MVDSPRGWTSLATTLKTGVQFSLVVEEAKKGIEIKEDDARHTIADSVEFEVSRPTRKTTETKEDNPDEPYFFVRTRKTTESKQDHPDQLAVEVGPQVYPGSGGDILEVSSEDHTEPGENAENRSTTDDDRSGESDHSSGSGDDTTTTTDGRQA